MPTDIAILLASHTPATAEPMIARLLAGGAIGLALIATWLWHLARRRPGLPT